jgi:alpha-tubulin suppressor-like RCC1 family protein
MTQGCSNMVHCWILGLAVLMAEPAGAGRPQGVLRAWGNNESRVFGNGTRTSSLTPVPAGIGLHNVVHVACGNRHVLALLQDGTVWAWGRNSAGQLGNGTTIASAVPVQVLNLANAVAIDCGVDFSLCVTADGTVWGWGDGLFCAIGQQSYQPSAVPVAVNSLTGATAVAASQYWSIAARNDSTAWGWGYNFCLQLGSSPNTVLYPAAATPYTSVVAVAAGNCHSLSLQSNGVVKAIGANGSGQLGNGSINSSTVPVTAVGAGIATAIAAGGSHSMSLRLDGTVRAWGDNTSGQLGTGNNFGSTTAVPVPGLTNIIAIDSQNSHSLALRNDGRVFMWGANASGQLGVGHTNNSNVPLMVNLQHAVGGNCGADFVVVIVNPAPCLADIAPASQLNGSVDMDDLLAVVQAWGTSQSTADIDGNGIVNIDDLLSVINAWGVCP